MNILSMTFIVGLLTATVRMMIPILLSALGETYSERAGILNIGLEGIMLISAFCAFLGSYYFNSAAVGILFGAASGLLVGLVAAFLSVTLQINQMISGIALNMAAAGLTSFFYRVMFGVLPIPPQAKSLPVLEIPVLKNIPFLGEILFQHNILVYAAFILVPVSSIILYKTSFGLKIRAVGENPKAVDTVGVSVNGVRYSAVCICGLLTGLAGTCLTIGQLNMFMDNISAGRGFIALAAVIFGKWNPKGVLFASVIFAFADALQLRLQSLGFQIPYQFLVMLPYVLTVVALAGVVGRSKGPAALGKAYSKEG